MLNRSGKTIDLVMQFLGVTIEDIHNKTLGEVKLLSAKIKKEVSLLFHTDMYVKHPDIHENVHKLFELIEPAIKTLIDYVENNPNYDFESEEHPEIYIVKPPTKIADYGLPADYRTKQEKSYHADFWYHELLYSRKIKLKKSKNTLLQQYEVLMGVGSEDRSDIDCVEVSAEEAFFDFYRQDGLNFSSDIDAMVKIFSVLSNDVKNKIIATPQFNNFMRVGSMKYLKKLLGNTVRIQTDEDVLRYFLTTTPERVTDSLFRAYVAEKAGHTYQEHLITKEHYARITNDLIAYLKKEKILDLVLGSAVCFLVEHQPSLASELFQSSERMLELRDTEYTAAHMQWRNWERVILVALANCGVRNFHDQEVLIAVLHPDVNKMAMFSPDSIQSAYDKHAKQLPEWVGSRVLSCRNITREMQIVPVIEVFSCDSGRCVISQSQADTLARELSDRDTHYLGSWRYLSNENTRPELRKWAQQFIVENDLKPYSRDKLKQQLLDHLDKLVKGEAAKFDFISLKRLAVAYGVEHEFDIAYRDKLEEFAIAFDNYVVGNYRGAEERESALKAVKECYMRLNSDSALNRQYKIWRSILRIAAARLVFGKQVPTELFVEDSAIYWLELGCETHEVYNAELAHQVEEKMKRLQTLFFDFRQLYRFSKSLGGAREFIEATKRVLPGLMYLVDGRDIQKWETIQEALEELNEKRVGLLIQNKPLALTHYEHTNILDNAATIGKSILATLTYGSEREEVHGLGGAAPSAKSSSTAIIESCSDPWRSLARLLQDALSERDFEKKYQVFKDLTRLKPDEKMPSYMLEALESAWKYHFKILCKMANDENPNKPGLFRATFTATPYYKMQEIFSFKAIKDPRVSFKELLLKAVDTFPDATEIPKVGSFFRCLAKKIGLDASFTEVIPMNGICVFDFSDIKLEDYKKIIAGLRELAVGKQTLSVRPAQLLN